MEHNIALIWLEISIITQIKNLPLEIKIKNVRKNLLLPFSLIMSFFIEKYLFTFQIFTTSISCKTSFFSLKKSKMRYRIKYNPFFSSPFCYKKFPFLAEK